MGHGSKLGARIDGRLGGVRESLDESDDAESR